MTTPPPFAAVSPLSPEQMLQMTAARTAMKGIRRAISVGKFDGWSLAVFAGLTMICGLSSVTALLVGLGLGIVAWVELRTLTRLKQLDPDAPKILAYNQIALAGVLIVYAGWNLLFPASMSAELAAPEIKSAFGDISSMESQLNQLVYYILIMVALGAQGSMALFYFRRTKMLQDYLANTPPWILQMQRAGFEL